MREIEKEQAVDLLKTAIRVNTVDPPGNEEDLARIYVDYLIRKGINAWLEPVAERRSNFVVKMDGASSCGQLVYCGHMDTVPPGSNQWKWDPFEAVEHDGRIYGRGASDMKSGLTAMVVALAQLKKSGVRPARAIRLIGTVGEEVNCLGARNYLKKHDMDCAGLLIIGEPTGCNVITRQKGAAWIEITAFGKTAHGSMPDNGRNAIYYINAFINCLMRFKTEWESHNGGSLGKATLSINRIQGGSASNMVADKCSTVIDFRLLPGQSLSDVKTFIEKILADLKDGFPGISVSYSVLNYMRPVSYSGRFSPITTAVQLNRELTRKPYQEKGMVFYTDASVLTEKNDLPVIFYGPGEDVLAHQMNESVSVENYLRAIEFYKNIAIRYS